MTLRISTSNSIETEREYIAPSQYEALEALFRGSRVVFLSFIILKHY